jgi:uncharacterized protein YfaA (DUF2138 family)
MGRYWHKHHSDKYSGYQSPISHQASPPTSDSAHRVANEKQVYSTQKCLLAYVLSTFKKKCTASVLGLPTYGSSEDILPLCGMATVMRRKTIAFYGVLCEFVARRVTVGGTVLVLV